MLKLREADSLTVLPSAANFYCHAMPRVLASMPAHLLCCVVYACTVCVQVLPAHQKTVQ
jgi:hypothetical protein